MINLKILIKLWILEDSNVLFLKFKNNFEFKLLNLVKIRMFVKVNNLEYLVFVNFFEKDVFWRYIIEKFKEEFKKYNKINYMLKDMK